MEFSELVDAIDKKDNAKINAQLKKLTPRLIGFLEIHMNAGRQDAEDCVQQALIKVLGTIRDGNIRNREQIFSYLLTACRHTYLNMVKQKKESSYDEYTDTFGHEPRQLSSMLDEERRRILEWCKEQLSKGHQEFIDYWLTHPNSDATAVSTRFDISVNNAWTRKHRILKKLSECYERKSNE